MRAPLLLALREPGRLAGFDLPDWDLLLRQAFATGLLGRVGLAARAAEVEPPAPVAHAVEAMLNLVEQQQRAVRWELQHLQHCLAALPGPIVLLKGAAYAAAELAPARGRMFSDIDLLVPRAQLGAAEAALMLGGWVSDTRNEYDQRYYRQWMHELPPMTQLRRGTNLDLHHRLLPLSARIQTPPEPVLGAAEALPGWPRFAIPMALDRILHSACHLFHEGEWGHGLRDLSDLDLLLRAELATRGDALWPALLERAARLNLQRPLYYALRHGHDLLATPVPEAVIARAGRRRLTDALLRRGLLAGHRSLHPPLTGAALFLLYVRGHALRMPARLLLPHLLTKAWMGWQQRRRAESEAKAAAGADAAANLERRDDQT